MGDGRGSLSAQEMPIALNRLLAAGSNNGPTGSGLGSDRTQ